MIRPLKTFAVMAGIVVLLFGFFAALYYLDDLVGAFAMRHAWLGHSHLLGQAIVNVLLLQLLFVMILATLLTLAERKWSAAIQNRIGPNRARIFGQTYGGVFHVVADALKMLTKEDAVPADAAWLLYNLAPAFNFAPIFCLFAIVPMGPPVMMGHAFAVAPQIANPDVGLLYVFGIASLAVYGVSLAGWASGNKLALLGGVRAAAQMISYEVALGLGLVGMMMAAGTLRLDQMVDVQAHPLFGASWLPAWGIFLQPVGFVLFFAAAFAETKRAPFDLPEGESEIIGYFLEYSGMKFGTFMIAEFVEVVTLSGILTAIFFGGYHLGFFNLDDRMRDAVAAVVRGRFASSPETIEPSIALTMAILGSTIFALKVILLCWLQLVIRWTFPRFRYDQIQWLGWRILLPIGLANVFVTGVCLLCDSSLDLLAAVGMCEIAAFAGLALWRRTPGTARAKAAPAAAH